MPQPHGYSLERRIRFRARGKPKAERVRIYSRDLFKTELVMLARERYWRRRGVTEENDEHGLLTGLVVETRRAVGKGEFMEIVSDYETDVRLMKERRLLMEQLARELGGNDVRPRTAADPAIVIQFQTDPD